MKSDQTVGVAFIVLLVTALSGLAVYGALRMRGIRKIQRVRFIAIAAWIWLLMAAFPIVLAFKNDAATSVVSVVVVSSGGALAVFLIGAAIYERRQFNEARRRDVMLGIPHQPVPRTWAGALAMGMLTFILAGVAAFLIAVPWLALSTLSEALVTLSL